MFKSSYRVSFFLLAVLLLFQGVRIKAKETSFVLKPPFATVQYPAKPFWKTADNLKRVRGGEALVSVKVLPGKDSKDKKTLSMVAVERVPVYADQAFEAIKEFEFFAEMKPYVVKKEWNPKKKSLYLHGQAFDYQAHLWMEFYYQKVPRTTGQTPRYQIHWRHTRGLFQGMTGIVAIEDVGRRMGEISMTTRYNFDKLPLPQFFVEFGLEVVLKKMAYQVKKYILKKNKK